MRRFLLALVLSAVACMAESHRKTLFIDKMGGFEAYLKKALTDREMNVEVIEEEAHPDLKVLLGKTFKSVYAELLYQKNTGRREESELKAIDVKTGKEIASYRFRMADDEASKQRAANSFVDALQKNMPR